MTTGSTAFSLIADVSSGGVASGAGVLAQGLVFLGDDFLPWIVLAFGAAMIVGNVLALVRPPSDPPGAARTEESGPASPPKPPLARVLVMIAIGAVAAVWGLASLLS